MGKASFYSQIEIAHFQAEGLTQASPGQSESASAALGFRKRASQP
jgi:hypothetical protein